MIDINGQLTKTIILHCFDVIFKSQMDQTQNFLQFIGLHPRTLLDELTALARPPAGGDGQALPKNQSTTFGPSGFALNTPTLYSMAQTTVIHRFTLPLYHS